MPFSVATLFQHAAAQGSRSTVLRPLAWLLTICASSLVGCVQVKAPEWVVVMFGVLSAMSAFLYLGAYIYCLAHDRDALRSETYSIQKLAIEKGYVGDSSVGMLLGTRTEALAEQSGRGEERR